MDIFRRGLIAGAIGSLIKDVPTLATHLIWGIPKIAYWDYAGKIGFGNIPKTFTHFLFALPIEWIFGISLGVVHVYLLEHFKPKDYLIAGLGLGGMTWFILRGMVVLYKLEPFINPDEFSAFINWMMSILFGLTVAYVNRLLKKKESQT